MSSDGSNITYYARDLIIRTYSVDGESNGIEQRSVGMLGSIPVRYKERFGSQKSWVTVQKKNNAYTKRKKVTEYKGFIS